MATNPNDVAKALNEMVRTLQELSDKELESVESIFLEHKKSLDQIKKIKEAKKELSRLKKIDETKEEQVRKEEIKTIKFKKNLLGFVDSGNTKLKNKIFNFSEEVKKNLNPMTHVRSFIQQEKTKLMPFTKLFSKKQSLEDYSRVESEDLSIQQLHYLKEIDSKIGRLTNQSSGGLFDSLFNSIAGMFGGAGDLAKMVGVGALGAGTAAAASGKGRLLRKGLGALLKGSKAVSKMSGKGKAGLILGGAALVTGGAFASSDDEGSGDTIQPRKSGGGVKPNNMYLVGEDGPELFTPKGNGVIIPNHKLKMNVQNPMNFEFEEFAKGFKKNIKELLFRIEDVFLNFDKILVEKIRNVYETVKKWVSGKIDDAKNFIKDVPKKAFDSLKDIASNLIPKPKEDSVPTTINVAQPKETKEPVSTNVTYQDNRTFKNPDLKLPDLNPSFSLNFSTPEIKQEPITIENNFTIQKEDSVQQTNSLMSNKAFWTKDFVTAFGNAIKRKEDNNRAKFNLIPDPYLK